MTVPAPKTRKDPAPCRGARRLLLCASIAVMLMVLAVTADMLMRASRQDGNTPAWMAAFSPSVPALWPAGTPVRHPETVHPGVNLRFAAGLEIVP
jgi:hypothetical protein